MLKITKIMSLQDKEITSYYGSHSTKFPGVY